MMKCPLCGLECCYAELLAENERLRAEVRLLELIEATGVPPR